MFFSTGGNRNNQRVILRQFILTPCPVITTAFDPMASYESAPGAGPPAGLDLSSGNGMNSLLSLGGRIIRPCFQSSLACSMRSLREETKFHQINRSPNGSPPNNMITEFSFAEMPGSVPLVKTSICPSL